MRSKNWLIGALIGLVAACVCAAAVFVAALGFFYLDTSRPVAPAGTPDPTQVAQQMDAIQTYVITTRGLQPRALVRRHFLTVEEVRERTIRRYEEDTSPEEMRDEARALAALGLVAPGVDLYQLLIRLYSEAVAGFYDPDTEELVLVSEAQGLNAYERTVFAHEYTHALQDQVFDLEASGYSDETSEDDPERFRAALALIEGDASLLGDQYRGTLSPAEQRDYEAVLDAADVSIYFELPDFLLQDFYFPYEQGLDFVRRYYEQGGWPRVDEVWRHPPTSTEHILHPERYEAGDLPQPVARPALTDTLGTGWRMIESNVLGAWYTYLVLAHGEEAETRLPRDTAARAAEGWGGDGYVVYYDDHAEQTVLAIQWAWDTPSDAEEFVDAFQQYGDRRFGVPGVEPGRVCWPANCLYFNGLQTLWILAPDEATAGAVLQNYPAFVSTR